MTAESAQLAAPEAPLQAREVPSPEPLSEREIRRNFSLGVFNGAAFRFAEALVDPPLVLTWFVSQLTSSNLLVGLISPIGDAGWFLPQIFLSGRLQRMPRRMPMYVVGAVVRTAAWLLLTAAVWFVDDPAVLLTTFFLLYVLARMAAGLTGLPFFDIIGRTVPARRRGIFFAWRQLLGGALALAGGWIVKAVLNSAVFAFPRGHALLFMSYTLVMVISMGAFAAIRERTGAVRGGSGTVSGQLRQAGYLLRENAVYRRYIGAQISLALARMSLPFYGIYAKEVLGAPEGMVGVYVAVRAGSLLLLNLPWGRLSDRRGNRLVLQLMSAGNGFTVLLALGLVVLMGGLPREAGWLPYLAFPLFILDGAMRPAQMLTGSNFLLELVPEADRPLYLGLSSTLTGLAVLLSGLGGLLVDQVGFAGLFVVSLGLYGTGLMLASGLPEPRDMPVLQPDRPAHGELPQRD